MRTSHIRAAGLDDQPVLQEIEQVTVLTAPAAADG